MRGAYDLEVTVVERGDLDGSVALCDRDDRCVGGTEGEICVALDELASSFPVRDGQGLDDETPLDDIGEQRRFAGGPALAGDQKSRFGDDETGGDQRTGSGFEERLAGLVVRVALVRGRDERTSVDDQHRLQSRPNPSASNSSASAARP